MNFFSGINNSESEDEEQFDQVEKPHDFETKIVKRQNHNEELVSKILHESPCV